MQIGKEERLAVLKELSQQKEQFRKCPHDEAFKDTFAVLVITWRALAVVVFLYRDPQDEILYVCKLLYSLCVLVLPVPKIYFFTMKLS